MFISPFDTLRVLPRKLMMEVWRRLNMGLNEGEPWEPLADVYETNENYHVFVELPGVKKEDIVLTIDKNKLNVRGNKAKKIDEDEEKIVFCECLYGSFEKAIEFTDEIEEDKVNAELQMGLLKVVLPKKSVSVGKRIEVSGE
ncbi:MAG TPA: Hsp20/alpha crystallin family protein [Candidatus Hydrogenedens sp.]|nr:Hsp20/alpha crystallin family protein [Candidatus Hydrogenedens sp.]HOK09300.1 Hsp20/alpha crystallin family protein [Candidatus Hydrogenedens sp.]HOL21144.1 Hsp20/alpha crystallin family protein [Candidatus Hydrogenedens sp.]HPP59809.1 Hsp20/alpha crystallin family protein [Candidatus Hydrogenedens sp.]